jgi:hypothetical protein
MTIKAQTQGEEWGGGGTLGVDARTRRPGSDRTRSRPRGDLGQAANSSPASKSLKLMVAG